MPYLVATFASGDANSSNGQSPPDLETNAGAVRISTSRSAFNRKVYLAVFNGTQICADSRRQELWKIERNQRASASVCVLLELHIRSVGWLVE